MLHALSLTIALILLLGPQAFAESKDGSLRGRIREAWAKRPEGDPKAKLEAGTTTSYSLTHGGLQRYYTVHVSTRYQAASPAPLLVVLHGGGGDMTIQANDATYGQISKSDAEGFIAVFPNGASRFPSGKLATWNAGRCCAYARDKAVDDVGFIREILQIVRQQVNVDPARIYATGMSNGAMMAYRLACELPDTFKAIAAVAGTDNTIACTPATPVSILHIHARDDDHVLFNGGAGQTFRDPSTVTDFTSVPATIAKWLKLNACTEAPQRVFENKGSSCERYTGCRNGTQVQLCVTATGGHSWPGGKKPRMLVSGHPSTDIIANDVMWEFFKQK